MTPTALVTYLKTLTGNRTGATFTDAWYLDRLNEGYRRLATLRHRNEKGHERFIRFPQFFDRLKDRTLSTSMTDNFVANQANVYALLGLYNRTRLRPIQHAAWRSLLIRNRSDAGEILQWTAYAQSTVRGYLIWKRPDADTLVDEFVYKYAETLTVAPDTAPVIDEEWHELIAEAAASKVARLQGNRDMALELEQQFGRHVTERRLPDEEPLVGGSRHFTVGVTM